MVFLNESEFVSLFNELRMLPSETEWIEFKQDNSNPEEIGEYISALANSAAMCGKTSAYIVWGIDDKTHDVTGTSFKPSLKKVGSEEVENWLLKLLSPKINFRFYEFDVENKHIVIMEIARAFRHPVQFQGNEYIRVGSYKRRLKDFPEKERELWRIFDSITFEEDIATSNHSSDEVLQLLDYPPYFDLLGIHLPDRKEGILDALCVEKMINKNDRGSWDITNLGAILFAKKIEHFDSIKRKAVRVIVYKGSNRVNTIREQKGFKGYASGFEGLIQFINNLLPMNEVIEKALRKNVTMYPEISVRELVVNAIIHQDFYITGAGPMIEIFDDRMEITNPGIPLVATDRFLDSPPRSRNEMLASFMRRIGVCEERGSGIDKVVFQTEFYQLPAPIFETVGDNTRAILFSHKSFVDMDREDRIRACYQHACLKYVSRQFMTNTSLRGRFGIEEQNSAMASRIIKDTVEKKLIHLFDPEASRKYAKYVPYWA